MSKRVFACGDAWEIFAAGVALALIILSIGQCQRMMHGDPEDLKKLELEHQRPVESIDEDKGEIV